MKLNIICLLTYINLISASIYVRILSGKDGKIAVRHKGLGVKTISESDLSHFGLSKSDIRRAVKWQFNNDPDHIFLAESVPWGHIHEHYCWEPMSLVTTVKNATVTKIETEPVVLATHDFENEFNETMKVAAGLTQIIQNSVSTKWSRNVGLAVKAETELKVEFGNVQSRSLIGLKASLNLGKSEEITSGDIAQTSTNVELPVAPGQKVTAVLEATRGTIEVTVIYEATIRGILGVSFEKPTRSHYYWGVPYDELASRYGLTNTATTVGVINLGFYTNVHTRVFDRSTGMLI